MNKITNHIWFDTQAKEAAAFYVSVFGDAKITSSTSLSGTPSGDVDMVSLVIYGQPFSFIAAGPYFKVNPSISFTIYCATVAEAEDLWKKLSPDGKIMMDLGTYPFSEKYGWIQDKFGVSWQINYSKAGNTDQKVTPSLLFVGKVNGKAEEAIHFYTSVFKNSSIDMINRYGKGNETDNENHLNFAAFTLERNHFIAMDSGLKHDFSFNEAISFMVHCDGQTEIDYFWDKLSAVPESEQCGWLKDKYGVSWQIVPTIMEKMMSTGDDATKERVTKAFLKMKKFNIDELQRAFDGK
jgi:predicted 3-demethylubiquinone-9 3-methyltransferase (glyoxalase superfamily)